MINKPYFAVSAGVVLAVRTLCLAVDEGFRGNLRSARACVDIPEGVSSVGAAVIELEELMLKRLATVKWDREVSFLRQIAPHYAGVEVVLCARPPSL